jgi:hypothetical protein
MRNLYVIRVVCHIGGFKDAIYSFFLFNQLEPGLHINHRTVAEFKMPPNLFYKV